ncbi:hypothetical protein EC917_112112 [Bacillus thuringiensis]|uniref:Uncharacterized protein n=1 Tax=Bacillus thuringiensis TaxID=1428 RepID=A0A4R4BBV1_BACTU|nr:hypothetical protein EC917_112112 [Bacillus thuringiensis]TCW53163.1 hypothetical protein EC910_112112 [Bacillus thuringiensis]
MKISISLTVALQILSILKKIRQSLIVWNL